MNKEALAQLFYREVSKIETLEGMNWSEKIDSLFRLLNLLFVEMTRKEKLHFTTLFARIAYVCHKNKVNGKLEFQIHTFRKYARNLGLKNNAIPLAEGFDFGRSVLCKSIEALLLEEIPNELKGNIKDNWPWLARPANVTAYLPKLRVVVLDRDKEQNHLIARSEEDKEALIRIQYNLPERNENFNPSLKAMEETLPFPVILNLIDIEIDTDGIYRPRAFVVEPDYLMDVSAVSECFKDFGTEPILFLLKKFLPFTPSKHLLIGNVANFFLDELMNDSEQTFKELFPKIFQLNPLTLCLFEDSQVREIMQTSQKHYINLKRMVLKEFEDEGIKREDSFIEPTFYSETYGLQGRLDVFHKSQRKETKSAIVELKSGKAYKPNIYGISSNHFIQTLLYDLIVRSVYGKEIDPTNYILYSGLDNRQLRFAPVVKAQQYEAIQVRNQLVVLERSLGQLGIEESKGLLEQGQALFARLRTAAFPKVKGFVQRDIAEFESVYSEMTLLERHYLIAFTGFIAREHLLAKTGVQGVDRANGLASLWLNKFKEKEENFEIISHLKVQEYRVVDDQPQIVFIKTKSTNPLANFRKGDIAVLYPLEESENSVLSNQIFKCTIIEINPEQVIVVLRSRQLNTAFFESKSYWNLEHDVMDGSFNSMYRGLFEFMGRKQEQRQLLLGQRAPKEVVVEDIPLSSELTNQQQQILKQLIASEDYFLLWGPPGTGKTSMVLKHTVGYLMEHSNENLLLLAYTNRAVDEICASIESLGEKYVDSYIRIGSRYATAERYQARLLSKKTAHCKTRKDLRAVIDQHRIIVATVASLSSKPELMKLKQFHRLIIDEASQILEPMLVGLLTRFKRFVLIGDHKQLPAVVVQDPQQSSVEETSLHEIGLYNLRNSLFERLYLRCLEKKWDWAYAQLGFQGRMHQEIMDFPNTVFYGGSLSILPENISARERQVKSLGLNAESLIDQLAQDLSHKRMLFYPTDVDGSSVTGKTNIHEAQLIKDILLRLKQLYSENKKAFDKKSVGIITPYRAQIAQIREILESHDLLPPWLTIDTVERYQGGARDVIIISLCTNSLSQLDSLVSLSEDGVDRKLNVAITRAKEQLILLGNPSILRYNPVYEKLIDYCLEPGKSENQHLSQEKN